MILHPNVHTPWRRWSEEETLHVACAYSNPYRWRTRRELMNDFRQHMEGTKNVKLYVGELAYGDRPHEVTRADCETDIQFRASAALFHKENILVETIKRFPAGWKYGCIFDADFTATRHDWALETVHQLQHASWVQPFSTYATLSAKTYGGNKPAGEIRNSFAATYINNKHKVPGNTNSAGWAVSYDPSAKWVPVGATGGAWAFTNEGYATTGGLLDACILGHADWFMAFGLVAEGAPAMHDWRYHPNYINMIKAWQAKAALLKQNIGVTDHFMTHHFHGSYKNRGYESRDMILVEHQFDPLVDLRRNWQGIIELTGNKPKLRDAIQRYFISRSEDDPHD